MKAIQTTSVTFIFCLLLSSCSFALLPPYSRDVAIQIENTAKAIDRFYLEMLERSDAEKNERDYSNFLTGYIDIEVELNSLYNKNRIRPLNKASSRNCEIALQRWQEYKQDHKSTNTISDGLIAYRRQYMSDLLYTIQIAEDYKQ